MDRRLLALLSALMLLAVTLPPVAAAGDGPTTAKKFATGGTFIVQLAEMPVVAYTGGIKGYAATAPSAGSKIDPTSSTVTKYVGYLAARHDAALRGAGGGSKLYDYAYSYNGFAAKLTAAQANRLAADKSVVSIARDETHEIDTATTPHFLGLDAAGGLWEQLGGTANAGEGIIIGVIDSGIWPESLSFTDRVNASGVPSAKGTKVYQQLPGWHGKCDSFENVIDSTWDANLCNQKLIGAQHFNASWGGDAGLEAERPWEFASPRDYNGHGTHTSSTAGGNFGTPTTGPSAGFGTVNGMAPRARIAAYKALYSTENASTASGNTSDLTAAIDRAVADGVDVINYSISGTLTNFLDAVEVSFMFAARAGIFVAESAGNSGPATSTVAHPSPWTTTVAAGTHNRNGIGSVTLGNGVTYNGASIASPVGPAPLINSVDAGLAGADATKLALCYDANADNGGVAVLDPAKVAGKIVVCDRGVTARVNKSLAVRNAGGVGMILVNVAPGSLNADFHFVPTVHLADTDRAAVMAYAGTAGATARINQSTLTTTDPAPFTATFSSRGPLLAGGGDLLKPDVIAPGQDILAAVAPPGQAGLSFNLLSGTSMSSPHVAGIAALLMDLHPSWSPTTIKSALMTSAYDVLDAVSDSTKIFRQGAGHIRPNSAADPGLIFANGFDDWRAFLKSQGLCNLCFGTAPAAVIDPSDFNGASIAIGALAGVQTVRRTVTNVSAAETYAFSYTGLAGITVTPSTSSLNPGAGASQSFDVTFTTNGAALNAYVGGFITWTGNHGHVVRMPVVIKPVALAAPAAVSGTGAPISYGVTFGYTGPFTATARGLIPATLNPGTVNQDPDQTFSRTDPAGTIAIPFTIAAGTSFARFQLFDADVDPGSDIDLYVFKGTTQLGTSQGGTSAEVVSLVDPAAGNDYVVYVHGWGVANHVSSPFVLYSWLLDTTDAGNMTVSAPPSATLGTSGTINLTFSGLAPSTKYLGSVAYGGTAGLPNPTIVRVDTGP